MRFLLLILLLPMLFGCVSIPSVQRESVDLPPVMRADELGNRGYRVLGRIQVNRTVYFTDYGTSPNLQEWGLRALREESMKLEADAVIFTEVTSKESTISGLPSFPATEYLARGVAIKFISP